MKRNIDDRPRARVIAIPAPRETVNPYLWRVLLLLTVTGALLLFAALTAHAAAPAVFPDVIDLPQGWRPEGIAVGSGQDFYVGSLANGAIYKGDLRTGQGDVLVSGVTGRAITGLKFDPRTNYIWAAGAGSGNAYLFDAVSGALVETYPLTSSPTFINDVVITREAVYFTDSVNAVFYRIPLGPGGRAPAVSAVQTISLTGDYQLAQGFNANGIDATPNGKWLIIVQSATGQLYRVDPTSGEAKLIDLGGASVTNGDGILLHGKTLYVVRNSNNHIVVINLSPDLSSGSIVDTITNSSFDVPTTIAEFGSSLYAVNARFSTPPTPDTEYQVVKVSR